MTVYFVCFAGILDFRDRFASVTEKLDEASDTVDGMKTDMANIRDDLPQPARGQFIRIYLILFQLYYYYHHHHYFLHSVAKLLRARNLTNRQLQKKFCCQDCSGQVDNAFGFNVGANGFLAPPWRHFWDYFFLINNLQHWGTMVCVTLQNLLQPVLSAQVKNYREIKMGRYNICLFVCCLTRRDSLVVSSPDSQYRRPGFDCRQRSTCLTKPAILSGSANGYQFRLGLKDPRLWFNQKGLTKGAY